MTDQHERESIKLRRLFFRKGKKLLSEDKNEEIKNKYKFYQMKMSWDQTLDIQDRIKEEILEHNSDLRKVNIRNFNPSTDVKDFIRVYNRAFITAPDPYRSLTSDDIKHFHVDSTFVAILYGKIVGFIYLTIEPLIKQGKEVGKQGVIAGIGVDPRYRRKRIAFLLAARAAEFFAKNKVSELVCEVYHKNKVSYSFIQNFGFTRTGTIYL